MNGRIYDPTLARFLSADPTVQSPGNPQNLNRYSYAGNNPLTYVDPSGYGWFSKLWKSIIRPIIAIVAAVYVGVYFSILSGYGFIGGAIGGFVGGFIGSGGNLQAGLAGAITGGIFGGIGDFAMSQRIAGAANWGSGELNSILAHAVGGGVSSILQGGKFGTGAISAGFAEGFSPFYGRAPGGLIGRTVAAATVGGTAARIGGSKFENGAKTAAYAYMFNSVAHAAIAGAGTAEGVFGGIGAGVRGALTVIGNSVSALGAALTTLLSGDTPRYTVYRHYGYAADSDNFNNGLRPGSFATLASGPPMSGNEAQQLLALPHAAPPDAYYNVHVRDGIIVYGPTPVLGTTNPERTGGGVQYYFPDGTPPGSVYGPVPISP